MRDSFVGPFVYPLDFKLNMETLKREYTADRSEPQPIRFFCFGRGVQFLGSVQRPLPSDLPAGGRAAVPARHRPARARHVLAARLRRAHFAHHRPGRRHAELHDRHHHRRHCRLLRRPLRFHRAAHHRGAALHPRAAALDGAFRGAAGDLGSARHLFRHHASSWRCSTGRRSRARCAQSSLRCARRTMSRRRR